MKTKIWLLAIIFLIVFLPKVLALDCEDLRGEELDICETINESEITEDEKDVLYLSVFDPESDINYSDYLKADYEEYESASFSIETDKLNYKPDETIKITIKPSAKIVKLIYGNQDKLARNYAEFKAKPLTNRITAISGNQKTEEIINVTNPSNWNIVWNFSLFSLINVFLYKLLRKYLGGLI